MRKLLMLTTVLMYSICIMAQEKTVTGKVTDEKDNTPLSGVSVSVKGTTIGTTTGTDGTFSLTVPETAKALHFTLVDYTEVEVLLAGKTNFTLTMASASKALSEVVVVAYGNQKKESITGSVAVIGSEQLQTRLATNISQALAGAAPGISATSGNGQPGSSAAIRIRGFGSVNASNSPLYVVDGFPYEGFIGDLNTNDIESITLLKDASSTALYGARAANGVVMITTKKGKKGAPKINITASTGISQRGIAEYDRVGTMDYYPVMWQALKNSLMYPASGTGQTEAAASLQASNTIASQLIYNPFNVTNTTIVGTDGKLNPNASLLYNDFDWFSPISKNGKRNEVAFNTSSKLDKTDYFISFNYLKDEGFVMKSDYERISARINLNTQLKDWLRSGLNLSGVFVTANQASASDDNTSSIINPFVFARGIGPIYPVHAFTATGSPVLDASGTQVYDYGIHAGAINRPQGAFPGRHVIYETELNKNVDTRNSLIGRTFLEGTIAKYFTATVNLGVDMNNVRSMSFQNKIVGDGVTAGGTSSRSSNEYRTVSMNQLINYKRKYAGVHEVGLLLGHENQWVDETYFSGNRRGMNLDGNYELVNFVTLNGVTGNIDRLRRDAYFSRLNYAYSNKYFLDVSFRRDASSRFAPKSRWGNFYSVGASWYIIRESFMKDVEWLSDLKIRAAYGTVGNDALGSYYAYQALYGLGWNNAAEPGALASSLVNEDLTWEVNKTTSLGIDFGFLKNRITGTLELFDRGSSELLFDVPQGLSSVVTTRTENIGSMSNKGIELQLNADVIKTKNFKWELQVNATSLKNKIKKLPNGQPITSGTKRLEEGRDIYAFYLRQFYGVDPNDGASLYAALPGITTGYRISAKGDTVVTNPTNARFGYSGSAIPKYFGSVSTTFNYKGFSVSGLFNYQIGGKFYDGNYAALMSPGYGRSLHADALNSWKTPGDLSGIPRVDIASTGNINAQSSRFLIDASYISLRNMTVAYAFGKTLLSKIKCDQMKVYLSGENIFVASKRKGLNPAESFNGTNSNIYVPNRIISAGINLTF
ncbi:MAG TPA: SusC/RagA family TonB-linked outer membrane protein [Chitinophagaceae bacterium]|nr:SusC/RagA family TonB-linked outer membrane protein [Chitinophagaceae bacterium]